MRPGWAIAYRTATMLGAAGLAALAFAQDTLVWDIVGAVLVAFAISDAILLVVVAWFRRRHGGARPPASRPDATDDLA